MKSLRWVFYCPLIAYFSFLYSPWMFIKKYVVIDMIFFFFFFNGSIMVLKNDNTIWDVISLISVMRVIEVSNFPIVSHLFLLIILPSLSLCLSEIYVFVIKQIQVLSYVLEWVPNDLIFDNFHHNLFECWDLIIS